MLETLKTKSDDELKEIILQINAITHDRDLHRKQQALQKIQALAGEVGLQVDVKPPRKRKRRKRRSVA